MESGPSGEQEGAAVQHGDGEAVLDFVVLEGLPKMQLLLADSQLYVRSGHVLGHLCTDEINPRGLNCPVKLVPVSVNVAITGPGLFYFEAVEWSKWKQWQDLGWI